MLTIAITSILIMLARVTDMTLDTVRTSAIVQGRRTFAAILGFFEAVVYISAVAKVLLNMDHPVYILAYGLGVALGTHFGITIERWLAFGQQMVFVFTHKGIDLATSLRATGYRLTEANGHGRAGDLAILYVLVPRRNVRALLDRARAVDENCFWVVNDVRMAKNASCGVSAAVAGAR